MARSQSNSFEIEELQNHGELSQTNYDYECKAWVEELQQTFQGCLELFHIWMEEVYEATELSQLENFENQIVNLKDNSQNTVNNTVERHNSYIEKYLIAIDEIKNYSYNCTFLIDESKKGIENLQLEIKKLRIKNKETEKHQERLIENMEIVQQQIALKKEQVRPDLTPSRVQKFSRFTADESHVGDRCVICMGGVEVGRNMTRLDCDGRHTFCQVCIEGWFEGHNTCPICRHMFKW